MEKSSRLVTSPLRQNKSSQPLTLKFIENDDPDPQLTLTITDNTKEKKKEKSVHFDLGDLSSTEVSVSETVTADSDGPAISWLPSEHLYSQDTFISETQTERPSSTPHSYGTSTFIDESADETRTASDLSLTDESLSSTDVFSHSSATGEWGELTEIVKDIEDLEESEFVTLAEDPSLRDSQADYTDFSDSMEEELAEEAKQNFLFATLRLLKQKSKSSIKPSSFERAPILLPKDSLYRKQNLKNKLSRQESSFYKAMIKRCQDNAARPSPPAPSTQATTPHTRTQSALPLEHWGLNPNILTRLRVENLTARLAKKAQDLDKETQASLKYIEDQKQKEGEIELKNFVSKSISHIQHHNTNDRIQSHLIRTDPVTVFGELVAGLPPPDTNMRDVLYIYKKQIEQRQEEDQGSKSLADRHNVCDS